VYLKKTFLEENKNMPTVPYVKLKRPAVIGWRRRNMAEL